jgi:RND family efflux transporter MFP subunit
MILPVSCKHRRPANHLNNEIEVATVKVRKRKESLPINSSGKLVSNKELKLSFKTGGIIQNILVDEGESVAKDQVLARLNLAEIQAKYNQAKLSYNKLQRDFNRTKRLYQDSVATLEQYQDIQTALSIAEAKLQIAKFNLKHSKLIAPSKGKVLKIIAEENEMIAPGRPAIIFGSTDLAWIVKTNIADKDIIKFSRGDSAIAFFDAYPDTEFPGTVEQIASVADPYTGTYEIEIALEQQPQKLVSGFIANVMLFPSKNKFYYIIPVEALLEANGQTGYVMVANDSIAQRKKVIIRQIKDSLLIVSEGINESNSVITDGLHYLKPTSKIRIVNRN